MNQSIEPDTDEEKMKMINIKMLKTNNALSCQSLTPKIAVSVENLHVEGDFGAMKVQQHAYARQLSDITHTVTRRHKNPLESDPEKAQSHFDISNNSELYRHEQMRTRALSESCPHDYKQIKQTENAVGVEKTQESSDSNTDKQPRSIWRRIKHNSVIKLLR